MRAASQYKNEWLNNWLSFINSLIITYPMCVMVSYSIDVCESPPPPGSLLGWSLPGPAEMSPPPDRPMMGP